MWPAILGMTYAILPDSKAGLAGGLILGVAGIGNMGLAMALRLRDLQFDVAVRDIDPAREALARAA